MLDVGEQARDEHEVDRAVADDLVRDVDVAALGVSRFGCHAAQCQSSGAVDAEVRLGTLPPPS
jgi:hypothetical protein